MSEDKTDGSDHFQLKMGDSEKFMVSNAGAQVVSSSYYRWDPKEDITTYELALCTPVIANMNGCLWEHQINSLPENCQRHFTTEANE